MLIVASIVYAITIHAIYNTYSFPPKCFASPVIVNFQHLLVFMLSGIFKSLGLVGDCNHYYKTQHFFSFFSCDNDELLETKSLFFGLVGKNLHQFSLGHEQLHFFFWFARCFLFNFYTWLGLAGLRNTNLPAKLCVITFVVVAQSRYWPLFAIFLNVSVFFFNMYYTFSRERTGAVKVKELTTIFSLDLSIAMHDKLDWLIDIVISSVKLDSPYMYAYIEMKAYKACIGYMRFAGRQNIQTRASVRYLCCLIYKFSWVSFFIIFLLFIFLFGLVDFVVHLNVFSFIWKCVHGAYWAWLYLLVPGDVLFFLAEGAIFFLQYKSKLHKSGVAIILGLTKAMYSYIFINR
ncbi:hypothetical protein ACJX0J_028665, partial [Zea mays]